MSKRAVWHLRPAHRDLALALFAFVALAGLLISFDFVEWLFSATRA